MPIPNDQLGDPFVAMGARPAHSHVEARVAPLYKGCQGQEQETGFCIFAILFLLLFIPRRPVATPPVGADH